VDRVEAPYIIAASAAIWTNAYT